MGAVARSSRRLNMVKITDVTVNQGDLPLGPMGPGGPGGPMGPGSPP